MRSYKVLSKQTFSNDQYSIVPIRYEDRLDIMKWRNEQIFHLRQAKLLTEEDQNNYFNNVVSKLFEQNLPTQILFSYLENEKCIGYGGLVHINWADKNAEISFIIDTELEKNFFQKHWTVYLNLIEQVAFNEIGLHKIFTYAFDLRPHLYEAVEGQGYIKEAVLKEHCLFNNEYKDVIIHSKINRNILLRKASEEDIHATYIWTNDEFTRKNSFSDKYISLQEHENWFRNKLKSPDANYYIFEMDSVPAAIVRFDKEKESSDYTIGINISPELRGKKLAVKFLKMACENFTKEKSCQVNAFIKKENIPSIKSFERAGFVFNEELEINGIKSNKYKLNKNE